MYIFYNYALKRFINSIKINLRKIKLLNCKNRALPAFFYILNTRLQTKTILFGKQKRTLR